MRRLPCIVTLAALTAATLALAQAAIPDLRRTWKGESESIVLGPETRIIPGQRARNRSFAPFPLRSQSTNRMAAGSQARSRRRAAAPRSLPLYRAAARFS